MSQKKTSQMDGFWTYHSAPYYSRPSSLMENLFWVVESMFHGTNYGILMYHKYCNVLIGPL